MQKTFGFVNVAGGLYGTSGVGRRYSAGAWLLCQGCTYLPNSRQSGNDGRDNMIR